MAAGSNASNVGNSSGYSAYGAAESPVAIARVTAFSCARIDEPVYSSELYIMSEAVQKPKGAGKVPRPLITAE